MTLERPFLFSEICLAKTETLSVHIILVKTNNFLWLGLNWQDNLNPLQEEAWQYFAGLEKSEAFLLGPNRWSVAAGDSRSESWKEKQVCTQ